MEDGNYIMELTYSSGIPVHTTLNKFNFIGREYGIEISAKEGRKSTIKKLLENLEYINPSDLVNIRDDHQIYIIVISTSKKKYISPSDSEGIKPVNPKNV
jgi:hypothetical protein